MGSFRDVMTGLLGRWPESAPLETRVEERVELGDRTRGFAYFDIDGLVPFVESLAGPGAVPEEAKEVLGALDSFILQGSGDGKTTTLSGFLRVTR